jgi:hypothetical protein
MTEPTRDDLRVAVFKKPGWGHRSIDDAEFAAIARKDGWVKPDERWRFCPAHVKWHEMRGRVETGCGYCEEKEAS